MNGRAIFQSTQQAIMFAYILQGLPARDAGAFGRLLERMKLEATGMLEVREQSSISFAGLNEMEVRAQCAMVRAAVENLLPQPESWAIRSRYGASIIHRGPDKTVTHASFGSDRSRCMRLLAGYLAPAFDTINTEAMLFLIARTCGEIDALRPTFRLIEQSTGVSKSAAERAEKRMKQRIRVLITLGFDRLTPIFERDGLVISHNVAA